jgi:hypothetical protein
MASVTEVGPQQREGFGVTERRDAWWAGPLAVLLGLLAFVVYSTWAGLQGRYFEIREDRANFSGRDVAPYLSPFYSPLLYDAQSPHRWFSQPRPGWWPSGVPFSATMLIIAFPLLFRLTCYYYRKAYYRAFWADPPACAVGEPRKSYWGENHWPLLFQNSHRYFLYAALLFIVFLLWDVVWAFRWPADRSGQLLPVGTHQLGMGLGTLIMLINVLLVIGFTFGCNSLRHIVGGRLNCFHCPHNLAETRPAYKAWRVVSWFNLRHAFWAWVSLISMGLTDLYIRLCSMGIWNDVRFF